MKNQPQGHISAMVFEHAYIDAMHSHVRGYKTITMWTYHPGMRGVLCLAVMEAERENTEMLVLFLELLNEELAKFKDHPGYKFNPREIMCNENIANLNAIATVLGRDFLGKTVTCQWHFRQCGQHQITSIYVAEQETFKELYTGLCYVNTVSEYDRICTSLDRICKHNNITTWFKWWKEGWFHIVPAFHGFNISGLNLAETGHSIMQTSKKLWLSVATWRDTCTMIIQD